MTTKIKPLANYLKEFGTTVNPKQTLLSTIASPKGFNGYDPNLPFDYSRDNVNYAQAFDQHFQDINNNLNVQQQLQSLGNFQVPAQNVIPQELTNTIQTQPIDQIQKNPINSVTFGNKQVQFTPNSNGTIPMNQIIGAFGTPKKGVK